MSDEQDEKRRHLRHSVEEPCTAYLEDGEYLGSVVNMSVSGTAIHLDIEVDAETDTGTIVELQIQRVGRISTRAVLNEFSSAAGH